MKALIKFLLIAIVFSVATTAVAQDVIVKKDNSTILSKVTKVSSTEIEYKKWSNQDGPTYTISVSEILSINYQNGDIDKFDSAPVQQNAPQNVQQTISPVEVRNNYYTKGHMERSGSRLTLNGRVLEDNEVYALVDPDTYETYLGGKSNKNVGETFGVLFWVGLIDGVIFYSTGLLIENAGLIIGGYTCLALADISLPFYCIFNGIGRGRLNWVADQYNMKQHGYSLKVSPSIIKTQNPFTTNSYAFGMTVNVNF